MEAYLEGWSEFNVAMMGAVAALAGLLIVAASVNVTEIIKAPSVAARLAAGLAGLVLAIAGSAIGLIPGITAPVYGAAAVLGALTASAFQVQATRRIYGNRDPANQMKLAKAALGFLAPLGYLVGGVLLLAEIEAGMVAMAVGAIAAIVAAILVSWVALVEILR